ncbi:FAD-binding oxidoreductase [Planotetraspora sp. A-T 1434]|uniref:globin domain-containing protein n=1 Tax=Planotetraspora sp. A-T 1434 TaxID=2979219 RepID=UPI0021BF1C5F|nr:globin domain-containing protein [Planotetraspora sp. A-T 1434]MCT9934635.1 FAD-binding oxidoreductase [Planotetraspora sp. A-T 1434]
MLSQESSAIVRATLPVVGAAIEDITARFYGSMFADNPELLRNLFNRGNQANGEQRSALAGSIAAFAAILVERPDDRPDTMLARIANKHVSLGITPDQYDLVHKYLFAAIAEVLGDAVTPEVAAAWDEVYWLMANALIALEAEIGRDSHVGWLQATVVERRNVTPDAVSFTLRPGLPLSFKPGQYVSVAVTLPDGARQIRQYSLSCAPERQDWRITVKRVRGGAAPDGEVSNWLHANVLPGDMLTISAPFGDLTLPPGDTPLFLASAGIGATPILSMVDHLATTESTRQVTVIHADRAPADHPHREELRRLVDGLPGATLHRWYEEAPGCACDPAPNVGQVDLARVELPERVVAYLCGPVPFMRSVRSQLLRRGVPASDIHYEVFGPDLWLGQD